MDSTYVSPCEDVVGACVDAVTGHIYGAPAIPEVWLQVGLVAIVVTIVYTTIYYAAKAYLGWKRA